MKIELPKDIIVKALVKTFQQRLNEIIDHFTFEANTLATREAIKYQVENLLEEARQQYIEEGKIFSIGDFHISAKALDPVTVNVKQDPQDETRLYFETNLSGGFIMQEIEKED